MSQTHFSDGTSAFVGALLCRATFAAAKIRIARRCRRTQHGAHRGSSSDSERRSLRIWVSAVAARANNFAMSEATALKRTGAMALACGGQVTKMTGACLPGSVAR